MKHNGAYFALVLGLPFGVLVAQETPVLAPGTRVRVTAREHRRVVGTLEAIDSATMVVRRENGTTVSFPRESRTWLDVSNGPGACSGSRRPGCVYVGFLSGALVGALAGFIWGHSGGRENLTDCIQCGVIYVVTVPAGAGLGTIVGAVVGGEHWKRVEDPVRVSVGPDGSGRFAFGLSAQF